MKHSLSISKKIGLSLLVVGSLFSASQTYYRPYGLEIPMSTVSVTMSNPRLSFVGRLAAGNVAGNDVTITTTAGPSSRDTAQLQEGDPVRIGTAGAMGSYVVRSTNPTASFSTVTANSNITTNDFAIASQSGTLTVRFITASAETNGKLRVLVPAAATIGADGIPDPATFDYTSTTPTMTCPTSAGNYTFTAPTGALASMVNIGGLTYHTFTCAYTGSGTAGGDFTSNPIVITGLINPSPQISPAHVTGTADTYKILVQLTDTAGTTVKDSTTVAVGAIEAVKVSAIVAPQITFSIAGIASAQTACAYTTGVTTSATDVPFGELALNTFRYAAQKLSVSTNASEGYAVTAIENDQLGLNGTADCSGDAIIGSNPNCIQDARGDSPGAMSHTAEEVWNVATNVGFAYTLESATGSPTLPFTKTSGCTGNNHCFRQFADNENVGVDATQVPQTIMSYGSVTNTQEANVCYGISVGATQASGTYLNYLTYTATGTF